MATQSFDAIDLEGLDWQHENVIVACSEHNSGFPDNLDDIDVVHHLPDCSVVQQTIDDHQSNHHLSERFPFSCPSISPQSSLYAPHTHALNVPLMESKQYVDSSYEREACVGLIRSGVSQGGTGGPFTQSIFDTFHDFPTNSTSSPYTNFSGTGSGKVSSSPATLPAKSLASAETQLSDEPVHRTRSLEQQNDLNFGAARNKMRVGSAPMGWSSDGNAENSFRWLSVYNSFQPGRNSDPLQSLSRISFAHLDTEEATMKRLVKENKKNRVAKLGNTADDSSARHCLAERRRRDKLNRKFEDLRALVSPSLSLKKDKATILGTAVELLKKLQRRLKEDEAEQKDSKSAKRAASMKESFQNEGLTKGDCNEKSVAKLRIIRVSDVFCDLQAEHEMNIADNQETMKPEELVLPLIEVKSTSETNHHIITVKTQDRPELFTDIMLVLTDLDQRVLFANSSTFISSTNNDVKIFVSKIEVVDSSGKHNMDELIAAAIACLVHRKKE